MTDSSENRTPQHATEQARARWWLNGAVWRRAGYWGTAAWMLAILFVTGGDTRHALFQYIFIVPLAVWVVGLTIAALLRRRLAGGHSNRDTDEG